MICKLMVFGCLPPSGFGHISLAGVRCVCGVCVCLCMCVSVSVCLSLSVSVVVRGGVKRHVLLKSFRNTVSVCLRPSV